MTDTDRASQVAEAMDLLGAAWRGDWSMFDGRTLRDQLGELAAALRDPTGTFDAHEWALSMAICPTSRGWCEHCPDRDPGRIYSCAHLRAWADRPQEAAP